MLVGKRLLVGVIDGVRVIVGVDKFEQLAKSIVQSSSMMPLFLFIEFPILYLCKPANGVRYWLVGGTRQRYFIGNNFKSCKVPENAQTPTSQVHAVLGAFLGATMICILHMSSCKYTN